jgi:anti-sigma regulatory factor (Ser/Thr protein kinase)
MCSSKLTQTASPRSVRSESKMCTRHISVSSRLDQIERIGQVVDECAQVAGFDDRLSYACQLAVGEACENIIMHGYGIENSGTIEATIHAQPGELTIELVDDAPPFNVAKAPENNSLPLDDPPIGGLGLRIIHKVMDSVEYHRRGDHNHLKLHKSCPVSVT